MMEFLSLYWIIGFALPPILFLLWNKWNLYRLTKHTLKAWRNKEDDWIQWWTPETTADVEDELKTQIDIQLQSSLTLSAIFVLNLLLLPAISFIFTLGLFPNAGWLLTVILMHAHLKKKARHLEKEGIPFRQVATHKRIKEELRLITEYNDGIVFPYLFLKSYQRSIAIHTEITEAIRTARSAEEGKNRVHSLTLEEKDLVREMNNAVMGRVSQQMTGTNDVAIRSLLDTIENQDLPADVRKQAMELLSQLQESGSLKPAR